MEENIERLLDIRMWMTRAKGTLNYFFDFEKTSDKFYSICSG